ncbi:CCA tRNA nucleotidyltransferase [Brackiella oedipodis]|uniref:CCA tRNA nucleotidyltransferase n=1 Tax=Brackiella oedipodis TaxID=124225 RepID=UPI0006866C58|nr:CCA tRNA nucleotidyltransferase [Brackiella oedipodis]
MATTVDAATAGLDVYLVGGAVRDALLQLPVGDKDWVVVGADPQTMVARGFTPVGGDFPVFLHPQTKEEYALARTERKISQGYKGFSFYTGHDVSLAQDLQRRDLTINAIAQDPEGQLHDPFGGLQDIQDRRLRHVSEAFVEDPVRILRLARFLARFTEFTVAPETLTLCRQMVANGEVQALVPERVWQEIRKALMAQQPSRCFNFLTEIHALEIIMPGLVLTPLVLESLDQAAQRRFKVEQRVALLCAQSPDPKRLLQALRAPTLVLEYALLVQQLSAALSVTRLRDAQQALDLLLQSDALRKPQRFLDSIQACQLLTELQTQVKSSTALCFEQWQHVLETVQQVDAGRIAQQCEGQVAKIKTAIYEARLQALQATALFAESTTDDGDPLD